MSDKFYEKIAKQAKILKEQTAATEQCRDILREIAQSADVAYEKSVLAELKKHAIADRMLCVLEQSVQLISFGDLGKKGTYTAEFVAKRGDDREFNGIHLFSVAVSVIANGMHIARLTEDLHRPFGLSGPPSVHNLDMSEDRNYYVTHINQPAVGHICLAEIVEFLLARVACTEELHHKILFNATSAKDLQARTKAMFSPDPEQESVSDDESELVDMEHAIGDRLLEIASHINRHPFYRIIERTVKALCKDKYALERCGNDGEGKAMFRQI